ncbi:MAG: NAD-dependent epimerase/dehydratase family protein, partial [Gemmatimonadales bacterium]
VFHVAGLIAARSEAEFRSINRDGTRAVLAAAAASGRPRFIHVSSLAAAGPSRRGERRADDAPPAPVTAYGRSKLAGEAEVRASSLPWTIVRPPAVYGPHDPEMLTVFKAVRLGVVPVFGDGRQELSLAYGPDLAEALAATAQAQATVGQTLSACHPEILTSEGLARGIAAAMERRVRVVRLPRWLAEGALFVTGTAARAAGTATVLTPDKAREFFAEAWTCDPDRLTRLTGWRAAHDLAAGARATASWYRTAGWL